MNVQFLVVVILLQSFFSVPCFHSNFEIFAKNAKVHQKKWQ